MGDRRGPWWAVRGPGGIVARQVLLARCDAGVNQSERANVGFDVMCARSRLASRRVGVTVAPRGAVCRSDREHDRPLLEQLAIRAQKRPIRIVDVGGLSRRAVQFHDRQAVTGSKAIDV